MDSSKYDRLKKIADKVTEALKRESDDMAVKHMDFLKSKGNEFSPVTEKEIVEQYKSALIGFHMIASLHEMIAAHEMAATEQKQEE